MKEASASYDAVIVGAGFAGLYMLHRLRELGLSVRVFETADSVGGTWYWNRYPGARCDIESMQYSYSFSDELQQAWDWSENYATQPEILRYANHVADRFELWPDIEFRCRVTQAIYVDAQSRWQLTIDRGDGATEQVAAKLCVLCTGCLSTPNLPDIAGIDEFAGSIHHTGAWPHAGVDFSDQAVAVIGTGSSGIQSIPEIAGQARHLTVFQRTPNYVVPAQNGPLDEHTRTAIKHNYADLRARAKLSRNGVAFDMVSESALSVSAAEREQHYERRWNSAALTFAGAYPDLLINREANDTAADFVRAKIRAIVRDPEVADTLCPDSTFACKRLCVSSDYYQTFNRDNVTLVDVGESGITCIEPRGPVANGRRYDVDALVLATGFDAMTGTLNRIDIRGPGGAALADAWRDGPRTYLGLMVAGFPNLFTVTGPGSPSVLSNMLMSIEYHVDWIHGCIRHLLDSGNSHVEATEQAQDDWVNEVNGIVDRTLYRSCDSWYIGANIAGKARVFMPYPGVPSYVERCDRIVADGYPGLEFTGLR